MLLTDLKADVIKAAQTEISATQLSIAVGGTSGKGNRNLTKILFPAMVATGKLTSRMVGRTVYYKAI